MLMASGNGMVGMTPVSFPAPLKVRATYLTLFVGRIRFDYSCTLGFIVMLQVSIVCAAAL